MTDDIVARLRASNFNWDSGPAADEIERLRAEIAELRLQNEILVQTTAELCDRCGWRMKFPGQPCRHCEAPALAVLEGEASDDAAT